MIKHAPWTPEEVEILKKYQDCEYFHPYTCHCHGDDGQHPNLVPTVDGWVCPKCDYKQDWFGTMTLQMGERVEEYKRIMDETLGKAGS